MSQHNESILIGGQQLSGILMGADYKVTRLSGWWERPAVKRNAAARELSDGDFPTPWKFESRYVDIGGRVKCTDHGQMHHIMDQLNGLCVTRREWLTIQGHGQTTAALVEPDDMPDFTTVTDNYLQFGLHFKATDPRRYGDSHALSIGSDYVTATQSGNYPSWPVIIVTAQSAAQGFTLEANSPRGTSAWTYAEGAWQGFEYRIDMRTGQIFVDGVERPERVQDMRTVPVRPREPMRFRVRPVDEGTVSAEVHYSDVWI